MATIADEIFDKFEQKYWSDHPEAKKEEKIST